MSERTESTASSRHRYKLLLKVDLERRRDSPESLSFGFCTFNEFETLIRQAIKVILGEDGSAKDVEVVEYDCERRIGCVLVNKEDFRLIWAALSIYGKHFGTDVAIRLQKVFEVTPPKSD